MLAVYDAYLKFDEKNVEYANLSTINLYHIPLQFHV